MLCSASGGSCHLPVDLKYIYIYNPYSIVLLNDDKRALISLER